MVLWKDFLIVLYLKVVKPELISTFVEIFILSCLSLIVLITDSFYLDCSCWLEVETGFIWAFVGPVIGIITVSFVDQLSLWFQAQFL